jgi:hypothetical protein
MLRWLVRLLPAVCLFSQLLQAETAFEDTPKAWDLPRFAAEGVKINEAAAKATVIPGADVVVLDEESSYVFDAEGNSVRTEYLVYKILTQNGAEGWDALSVEWEPWHAERPALRARVITPDNVVHTLDAKTITDGPALDENEKTYGDGRTVRAPLPAIAVGSVVEEEEVLKESAPMFGTGIVALVYFGRNVPVQHSKLTLDAPAALPLRYATKLLSDVKPQKNESGGRTQIVFEKGPMDALDEIEPYLPADVPARPEVRFSTGASWQAIAQGYGIFVDEKAAAKDVQTLVIIARAESTRLVNVPEASSEDNRIVEKREFFLSENGPARVVETTEPHGVFESQFRAAYADADNKDNRKSLKDYVAYEYLADSLTRMERSDPADLSKQFQLTLEAGKARRGFTELESAVAAIRVETLFNRLPDELKEREKEEEKGADPVKDKPKKPRAGDYQRAQKL